MRINGGMARYRGGVLVKFYRLWLPCEEETSEGMADVNGVLGVHSATLGRFFALEVKAAELGANRLFGGCTGIRRYRGGGAGLE